MKHMKRVCCRQSQYYTWVEDSRNAEHRTEPEYIVRELSIV